MAPNAATAARAVTAISSIGARERDANLRGAAADEAVAGGPLIGVVVSRRHAAGLGFDASLALGIEAPGRPNEAVAPLEVIDQLGERRDLEGVVLAKPLRPVVELPLEVGELATDLLRQVAFVERLFVARNPVDHDHLVRFDLARPDLEPERDAPQLPVVVLVARADVVAPVDREADAVAAELDRRVVEVGLQSAAALLVAKDRHDRDLDRGDLRRQDQPGIVAVGHDQAAYRAS